MSLATLRQATADALATIPNLRAVTYVPDQVNPPPGGGFAVVEFGDITEGIDFDGGANVPLSVTVFAQRSSERASQIFLDTLRDHLDPASLKATIEGDADIAAAAAPGYVHVAGSARPVEITVGDNVYLAVEFTGYVIYG